MVEKSTDLFQKKAWEFLYRTPIDEKANPINESMKVCKSFLDVTKNFSVDNPIFLEFLNTNLEKGYDRDKERLEEIKTTFQSLLNTKPIEKLSDLVIENKYGGGLEYFQNQYGYNSGYEKYNTAKANFKLTDIKPDHFDQYVFIMKTQLQSMQYLQMIQDKKECREEARILGRNMISGDRWAEMKEYEGFKGNNPRTSVTTYIDFYKENGKWIRESSDMEQMCKTHIADIKSGKSPQTNAIFSGVYRMRDYVSFLSDLPYDQEIEDERDSQVFAPEVIPTCRITSNGEEQNDRELRGNFYQRADYWKDGTSINWSY